MLLFHKQECVQTAVKLKIELNTEITLLDFAVNLKVHHYLLVIPNISFLFVQYFIKIIININRSSPLSSLSQLFICDSLFVL